MAQEYSNQQDRTDEEIDLLKLVRDLWNNRRLIIIITVCFAVLGIFIALLSTKEYTAEVILLPQTEKSNINGEMNNLAAMAGINLGANTASFSPAIYPDIVNSVPFQLELMYNKFSCPHIEKPITLYEYYTKHKKPGILSNIKKYTIGLPGLIIGTITETITGKSEEQELKSFTGILPLTREENAVVKALKSNITIILDNDKGVINITFKSEDPLLSAEVTQEITNLLRKNVADYKLELAKVRFDFISSRLEEKKIDFEYKQRSLAEFMDRNFNVSSAVSLTRREQLQTEYNLAFSIYSELAKKYESSLLSLKENTPVLTIVEPVTVPLERSSPNRPLIIIIYTFLGGILGVGYVLGMNFVNSMKDEWHKYDNEPQEI